MTTTLRRFLARLACTAILPAFLAASAGATEQFKVTVSAAGTGVDVAVGSLDFGVDTAATDGLDDGSNGTQSLDVPAPPTFVGASLQFSDVVPAGGTGLVTDFRDANGSKVWTFTASGITSGSSVTLTWVPPTAAYLTGKSLTFKGNGADVNMLTSPSTTLTQNGTYSIVLLDPAATNFPPVAQNDAVSTLINQAVTVDVLANDRDPNGDTLTISAAGTPAHGAAAIASGKITYTPAAASQPPLPASWIGSTTRAPHTSSPSKILLNSRM